MSEPLHPNLARMAARYDEIFQRWSSGHIDATQAKTEIASLVARDDEGVLWSINPVTGGWLRKNLNGEIVEGTPPTYGLATPTAHDISSNPNSFNPDNRISFHAVDDDLLTSPKKLYGSTRTFNTMSDTEPEIYDENRKHFQVLLIGGIVGLVVAGILILGGSQKDQAPVVTTPSQISVSVPNTLPGESFD